MHNNKLKVKILFSAVGDNLPCNWEQHSDLISALSEKAVKIWTNRQPSEKEVRFIHRLPTKSGMFFRFFTVTEENNGSLLVSRGGLNE